MPAIDGRSFVCCLGSKHSPLDREVPVVADTLALIAEAVEREIPVLGLCYGGQVLADVLGGVVEPAPEAELGWYSIESDDPDAGAGGPMARMALSALHAPAGRT